MEIKFWFLVIGVGLISVILIGAADKIPLIADYEEIANRFGEALFISAFLAGTVDSYLKGRFARQVAKDVSPFIMGYALPVELRHEIREASAIEVYRTGLEIDYELIAIPSEEGFVILKASSKYRVHNLSDAPKVYNHRSFVQKPHKARKHIIQISNVGARGVTLVSRGPICSYNEKGDLGQDDPDGFSRMWEKKVWIPERTTPETAPVFWGTTFQVLPREHADIYYTLMPTVGITVRVKHPEWMTVIVSFGHRNDEQTIKIPPDHPTTWELQAAFLPMQTVLMEWRERPTPDVSASVASIQENSSSQESLVAEVNGSPMPRVKPATNG